MGIMVHSLLWVVQDVYHQAYFPVLPTNEPRSNKVGKGSCD